MLLGKRGRSGSSSFYFLFILSGVEGCSDPSSSDKKVTFSGTVTLEGETNKILRV